MTVYSPGEFKDWQIRVIDECRELNHKIDRLYTFIIKDDVRATVAEEQFTLMCKQHTAMCNYRNILRERIALFF
jgi:hypothetical protein